MVGHPAPRQSRDAPRRLRGAAAACDPSIDQTIPAPLLENMENGPYGRDDIIALDRQLYAFAKQQYGSDGNPNCSANLGRGIEGDCVFHDIVSGDIDVYCQGGTNCYQPSGNNGVLSRIYTGYMPSYRAAKGYDFATGLGSVNAYNLVMQWPN